MTEVKGTIANGINNIFTVTGRFGTAECRIKGKVLKDSEGDYNPLAAGDEVMFLPEENDPGKGKILSRTKRRNALVRWNKKGRAPQTISANIDLLVCVTSPFSPPFRPRFLDRLLVAAEAAGIPAAVCMNKIDHGTDAEIEERLAVFEDEGCPVFRVSAADGTGMAAFEDFIAGKRAAFVGQSGVGKTSLLNRIAPGVSRKVGRLSEKYNRGCHTTVLAHLEAWARGEIIDTPGVREFEIHGVPSQSLHRYFGEFGIYAEGCAYAGCTHVHEPDCAVRKAVEEEEILFDRYESYLRIYDDLRRRERSRHE